MALVNRWYRILERLVTKQGVSLEELRLDLNVSMSTLQKSLEQLNDLLDSDLQIKQVNQTVFLEVYDYRRLEDILAGSLRRESDFNSSSKRVSYLIKRLVQSLEPLLIDDLAEEIGVSRTTINKDLRQVKELAEDYQVTIIGKPNHGLEISGSELQLRLFYIHHVYSYFQSDSLTAESQRFLMNLYQTFKLPKKTQELLTKAVSVTLTRLRCNCQLEQPIACYTNELIDSELVHQLVNHIELTYQFSLSQYEQDFISFPLNIQHIDGLPYSSYQSKELVVLFKKMVQRVQNTLFVAFNEDSLYLDLHRHLKFLINRLIFHVQANDIFHGDILNKYPLAFEMAKVAATELQESFGYRVWISELSYLALYFELALREDGLASHSRTRQIAVVCTTGLGTANMICRQLRRVLGQEIQIYQYSEEEFNPEQNDDYFAIFTTIPLKLSGLKSPVVHLTNLFDDRWLQEEWQRINYYHQKNLETVTLKFIRLSKKISYSEYIKEMIGCLEKDSLVDRHFLERALEREKQQSTIFGNGIGFPHTVNQMVSQTILMVGVLDDVHHEDGKSVELIFMIAIPQRMDQQMESELLNLYDDIFRIASNPYLKLELKKVETEAEFITFTRNKGVF